MPTPFLHQLPLGLAATNIAFSFVTDYAVVAGVSEATGEMVLPTALDQDYLVPGGIAGLPYVGELGAAASRVQAFFPVAVTALLVATYTASRPVPQGLVASMDLPPAPVILSFTALDGLDYLAQGNGFVYPISIVWDKPSGMPPMMYLPYPGSLNLANGTFVGMELKQMLAQGFQKVNPYAN